MIDAWHRCEGVREIVRAAKVSAADVTMELN
jgi:hypothetical protein